MSTTNVLDDAATGNAILKRDANGDAAIRILTLSATSGGLKNQGFERGGVYSASATFTVDDQAVNGAMFAVTTGSSNRTAALQPAASATGEVIEVVKVDSGTGTVTVDPDGSETIGGASTYVLTFQYDAVRFRSDGTNWQIISTRQPLARETIGASTAAAGTTTADAGVLPAGTANVYLVSAADDTKGVRIHATDKVDGRRLFIGNNVSNKILKVYAPSGGTINGAAADAAYSSASGKSVAIICTSASSNTWVASG